MSMLTCTLIKVLLSIALGSFDNYWQPQHAIGYVKRTFIQELTKQEKRIYLPIPKVDGTCTNT